MKINYTTAAAIILAGLSSVAAADFYSQNFNGMGTTGTTPPSGWSMWYLPGDASSLVIPTGAEMATATAGQSTLVVWNQTEGNDSWFDQAANMGSSSADPNRLLGTSPTGSRGSILQLSLPNNTGQTIIWVSVAYDMQCLALGTVKSGYSQAHEELPGYSFYYLNGGTWTHVPSLDLSNDSLNSVGHASFTINLPTPVANGGTLQFRWFDDDSVAFSPDFMFAIDNVVVNVGGIESGPQVNLLKAVKPWFTGLALGMNYQLQVSADLNTWTNQGSPFTATSPTMIYPQYWDVDNWNQLYFRLQLAP